jgi:hypothetical protein
MKWRWFYAPMMLATLPLFLVMLAVALVFYKPQQWRWSDGCLEFVAGRDEEGETRIWGTPGGQTFGCPLIAYASVAAWNYRPTRLHERVHVIHSAIVSTVAVLVTVPLLFTGGWWLLLAVALWFAFGISYGVHYVWGRLRGLGHDVAYRRIWTERIAYRLDEPYRADGIRHNDPPDGVWGS